MKEYPANIRTMVNARVAGFDAAMGLSFVKITPEELVAELEVGEQHRQAYGLVHGGVYSGMIETVCSTGAALGVYGEGRSAVGLENATTFLRAVRGGKLTCTASPMGQGRRTQVWEARVHDDRDRLVAAGRVRLLVLDEGASAGGKKVALEE